MSPRPTLRLCLVVCLAVTAGCSFFGPQPESYTSTYDYSVGIDADETLRNLTVRVPMAQLDGTPVFEASDVAPNGTLDTTFDGSTTTNRSFNDTFGVEIVETRHGPMLELTADRLTVETRYYRFVENETVGRIEQIPKSEYDASDPTHSKQTRRTVATSVVLDVSYPIETQSPVGASPVFYTGGVQRALVDCRLPYQAETACFDYRAPVYLSYDTAGNASVDVSATFTGSNEWFSGGWTGNDYQDRVHANATGPQDGWVQAAGHTETGRGRYPTPDP